MKVVAFNGSPKPEGNTSILLNSVLKEIELQGIDTELIQIGGQVAKGCTACGKCYKNQNQKCVILGDQINDWIQKILDADGVLLGSPTYFADVSTETKAFIDRVGRIGCRCCFGSLD